MAIAPPDGTALSCRFRGPRHQLLGVVGGVEEAAIGGLEVLEDGIGQLLGGLEEALLEGGLVEREQALGEVGVVLEGAAVLGHPVLPGAQQSKAHATATGCSARRTSKRCRAAS